MRKSKKLQLVLSFLSTPSARRATAGYTSLAQIEEIFLSTPSARRATLWEHLRQKRRLISIHALREEGDGFYRNCIIILNHISIHALREEGDAVAPVYSAILDISIHALREEGDGSTSGSIWAKTGFLSTPSARRATFCGAQL